MIGTGALAPQLIRVHAKVRPIRGGRDLGPPAGPGRGAGARARGLAAARARPADHGARRRRPQGGGRRGRHRLLRHAFQEPLVEGDWLGEGQHLDLVGAYTPEMRESDDKAVWRARVYVDTRAGALKEGGDIVQPLRQRHDRRGRRDRRPVRAGARPADRPSARRRRTSITLFKSVGTALEDLAAAELAVEGVVRRARTSRTGLTVSALVSASWRSLSGSISAPACFSASISAALTPASASTARESAPISGAMVRIAGGVRLMRIGGSTIMISPSLGCGYFLKSWRHTRCGSSNRSAGLRYRRIGDLRLVEQADPFGRGPRWASAPRPWRTCR